MNIQFHNGIPLSSYSEDVNADTVFTTKLGNKTLKNMVDGLQSNIDTVRLSSSYNVVENKIKQPREFLFKDYKPILDKVRTGDFSGVQLGDTITLLATDSLEETHRVRLIIVHKDPYYNDLSNWYMKRIYKQSYDFHIRNGITPSDAEKEAKEEAIHLFNMVSEHPGGVICIFDRFIPDEDMFPYEHSNMRNNVMKWCYDTIKDAVENRILKRELFYSYEQYLSVLTQEQVYGRVIKGKPSFDMFQLDYFKNRHLNTLSGCDILLQNDIDEYTYCVATDKFLAPEIINKTSLISRNIYVIPFFLLN